MRQSVAAIALIRREEEGQTLWLAQWNEGWQAYAFVGGHKRADESFRECLIREVSEELDLLPNTEFTTAPEPVAHLQYTAWSASACEKTEYTIELFDVQVLGASPRRKVDAAPENRWLTEEEIRNCRTTDDRPVSETAQLLLSRAGLLTSEI